MLRFNVPARLRRFLPAAALITVSCIWPESPVRAASLTHTIGDFGSYLVKGPTYWIDHSPPSLSSGDSIAVPANFTLKSDQMIQALNNRRDQNPIAFDAHHPQVASVLINHNLANGFASPAASTSAPTASSAALETLTPPTTTTLPVPLAPRSVPTPAISAAPEVFASPVPEPSTIVYGMALLAVGQFWRRGRRALG